MSPEVSEYFAVLRRSWRLPVGGALLLLTAAAVYLLVAPAQYQSTTTFLVRTPGDVSMVVDGGDSYAQTRARTYAELAGPDEPESSASVTGTARDGTALFDVTVSDSDRNRVTRLGQTFAESYQRQVAAFETVPGSVIPRAELVIVNPPSAARRSTPGDLPAGWILSAAAGAGALAGMIGAVILTSRRPTDEVEQR